MLELDPKTTALVLIDLQKGIIGHELTPHRADQVSKVGSELADTFRKAGAPVVLVNVGFAKDFKDALRQPVDRPFAMPPGGFPENFSDRSQQRSMTGMINITGDWTRSLRSRVSAASVMSGGASGSLCHDFLVCRRNVRVGQLLRRIRATNYGQVVRVT